MLAITPFGYAFLLIVIATLIWRREWLLPLTIVSACLHAPAVVVIGGTLGRPGSGGGISPWLIVMLGLLVHLSAIAWRDRRLCLGSTTLVRRLFLGWSVFFGWAILSAFLLPIVFEGTQTYNPGNRLSLYAPMSPLAWRPINAVHAVGIGLVWLTFLYLLQVSRCAQFASRLLSGFFVAGGLALALSLTQRLIAPEALPWTPLVADSLNPSYHQPLSVAPGGILRANWPFSEPSYASAWFAAFFSGGLGLAALAHRPFLAAGITALGAAGVTNSLGGSGIAGAALSAVFFSMIFLFRALRARQAGMETSLRRAGIGLLLLLAVSGGSISLLQLILPENISPGTMVQRVIKQRINDHARLGPSRTQSNLVALRVTAETMGLGVGLGGNRASSLLLNLVSNVGVAATLLMFVLVTIQARLIWRIAPADTLSTFVVCGQVGIFFSAIVGVPDITWPAIWIWVAAAFGVIASKLESQEKRNLAA